MDIKWCWWEFPFQTKPGLCQTRLCKAEEFVEVVRCQPTCDTSRVSLIKFMEFPPIFLRPCHAIFNRQIFSWQCLEHLQNIHHIQHQDQTSSRSWRFQHIAISTPPKSSNVHLVGGSPTPLKNMMSSSVGMMTFPTEWKIIKAVFQTTNSQSSILYHPGMVNLTSTSTPLRVREREEHKQGHLVLGMCQDSPKQQ